MQAMYKFLIQGTNLFACLLLKELLSFGKCKKEVLSNENEWFKETSNLIQWGQTPKAQAQLLLVQGTYLWETHSY